MSRGRRKHYLAPVALGLSLAVCASVALAQGESGDDQSPVCEAIACANGTRFCAAVTGTLPVFIWSPSAPWGPAYMHVPVSFTCYELAAT